MGRMSFRKIYYAREGKQSAVGADDFRYDLHARAKWQAEVWSSERAETPQEKAGVPFAKVLRVREWRAGVTFPLT